MGYLRCSVTLTVADIDITRYIDHTLLDPLGIGGCDRNPLRPSDPI